VREPGRTAGPSAGPCFLSKTVASADFMQLSTESRIRCRWRSRDVGNPGTLGMTKGRVVTFIRGRQIGWTEEKQQVPFDFAPLRMKICGRTKRKVWATPKQCTRQKRIT
jgi:hypothetical protein